MSKLRNIEISAMKPRILQQNCAHVPRTVTFRCGFRNYSHPKYVYRSYMGSDVAQIKTLVPRKCKVFCTGLDANDFRLLCAFLEPCEFRFWFFRTIDELTVWNGQGLTLERVTIIDNLFGMPISMPDVNESITSKIMQISELVTVLKTRKLVLPYVSLETLSLLLSQFQISGVCLNKLTVSIEGLPTYFYESHSTLKRDDELNFNLLSSIFRQLETLRINKIVISFLSYRLLEPLISRLQNGEFRLVPTVCLLPLGSRETLTLTSSFGNLILISGKDNEPKEWLKVYKKVCTLLRKSRGPYERLPVDLQRELVCFCYVLPK